MINDPDPTQQDTLQGSLSQEGIALKSMSHHIQHRVINQEKSVVSTRQQDLIADTPPHHATNY